MAIWATPQSDGSVIYKDDSGTIYTAEQLKQMKMTAYNSKSSIEKAMINHDGSYTLLGDVVLFVIFVAVVMLLFLICRYLFRRYSDNVKSLMGNVKHGSIDIILSRLSSLAIIGAFIYWFINTLIL